MNGNTKQKAVPPRTLPWGARRRKSCSGQSVLEAALVIVIACLLAFGMLQVAQLMIAKSVMTYAAAAGARARTVGFNDFMTYKVVRVAAIPTAGALEYPVVMRSGHPGFWGTRSVGTVWNTALRGRGAVSPQLGTELPLIPLYLEAGEYGRLQRILRYERWPDLRHEESGSGSRMVHLRVEQQIPLVFPFHRAFILDDSVRVQSGEASRNHQISRGRHAELYLE